MSLLAALARRHWPITVGVLVLAVLSAVHQGVFGPTLARYRRAAALAAELGMPLDTEGPLPGTPAAVSALLANNSLNAALVQEQGNSGALTAGLLESATTLATRSGLTVLSTDQGLVTQLPGSVQVRAHLRMRGTYAAFVRFLGSAAGSGTLLSVDRFVLTAPQTGPAQIDTWVTQLVLKRGTGAR